ncbi:MAG: hypothetical protein JW829_16060 [Pirellulales bacterium]|nr:hypothetical protein [Pirellulales bacterium]
MSIQRCHRLLQGRCLISAWLMILIFSAAQADIVVLANRTNLPVRVQVHLRGTEPVFSEIASGSVLPVVYDGPMEVSFLQDRIPKRYLLDANAAYYFSRGSSGQLDLHQIGLNGDATSRLGRPLPGRPDTMGAIGITIAVDEEEAAKRAVWEKRLRRRIQAASDILERHCRIRLEVVRVTTWDSEDGITDLEKSLHELEKEVNPLPGRLAIGFTSQYQVPHGRTHLGGTRGPLRSHILIREWSRHIEESERLELLVHELGHHFGAVHSPEADSVMRPILGDRHARLKSYVIRFDPVNSLIVSLVGEEIRRRGIRQFSDLTAGTKQRLRQIYAVLEQALPDDESARIHQQLLNVTHPNMR